MKLYRSENTREAERYAIEKIGMPSVVLMEHAARGVLEEMTNRFSGLRLNNFLILYGTGNNGGDALCLARMLILLGCRVNVVQALGEPGTQDAKLQKEILLKTAKGQELLGELAASEVSRHIDENTIVIDGVFGTGFKADNGLDKSLVKLFADVRKAPYVISIDVPSGIDADTGEAAQGALTADCTVSFIHPKLGLFISPASLHVGDIIVKPIFSPAMEIDTDHDLVTEGFARELIAPLRRSPDSHKGTYGHVAVISPEKGMEGAVAMSAMAALRSGSGLVSIVTLNESREDLRKRMPMLTPEVMITSVSINEGTGPELSGEFDRFQTLVVGPGFGRARKMELGKILEHVDKPMVIDADALNIISEDKKLLNIVRKKDAVLTPHPGEMSRLHPEVKDVQAHRLKALEGFVKGSDFCVLLKGYRSMLGMGNGHVLVNYTGNPSLSKGGSGDVLSGLVASFIAQGLKTWMAGALAMYVHGVCADRLVMDEKNSDFGILPTDIIKELGHVIKCLTE